MVSMTDRENFMDNRVMKTILNHITPFLQSFCFGLGVSMVLGKFGDQLFSNKVNSDKSCLRVSNRELLLDAGVVVIHAGA